jgi:hypothetical protein
MLKITLRSVASLAPSCQLLAHESRFPPGVKKQAGAGPCAAAHCFTEKSEWQKGRHVRSDDLSFAVDAPTGHLNTVGSALADLPLAKAGEECRSRRVTTKGKITVKAIFVARRSTTSF